MGQNHKFCRRGDFFLLDGENPRRSVLQFEPFSKLKTIFCDTGAMTTAKNELFIGFGEVHVGFGVGQINDGGIRLLDWAIGKGLHLMNTCFQKKKSWLMTFRSGETETD